MKSINPYLNFSGNAEKAFDFYKSVFGGEFLFLQRFKEMPDAAKIPASEQEKIMHISLPIGKGNILMGSDASESMDYSLNVGNNFYLSLSTESEEEATQLFNKLSEGGKVQMEMQKTFWGSFFGMLTDKFDVQWMVSYEYNQQ